MLLSRTGKHGTADTRYVHNDLCCLVPPVLWIIVPWSLNFDPHLIYRAKSKASDA